MAVTIRQLHPHFFGEVSGVDLRKPLTAEEASDIEAGMDKYAVLLFRDQDITDEQQLVFARNFGERESARGGTVTKREDYRLTSGLNDVSNLGKDGKPLPRDHRTHLFNLGNCLWHSDSSFRPIPAKFSLLSARLVNPKGGNTEFADMRAAYDALDDETKAEIEDLICENSLMYSPPWRRCANRNGRPTNQNEKPRPALDLAGAARRSRNAGGKLASAVSSACSVCQRSDIRAGDNRCIVAAAAMLAYPWLDGMSQVQGTFACRGEGRRHLLARAARHSMSL